MPRFSYKAIDKNGQAQSGSLDAESVADLTSQLQKRGLFLLEGKQGAAAPAPVTLGATVTTPSPLAQTSQNPEFTPPPRTVQRTIGAMTGAPTAPGNVKKGGAVHVRKVVMFTTELSIMIRTSLPIMEAFEGLWKQQADPVFQAVLHDISNSVRDGKSLSEAFAQHPKVFDGIYLSLLRAGESSGQLSKMLDCIVDYLNFRIELESKIRGALMYPTIVIVVSLLVVSFLIFFIMPTFKSVFDSLGVQLPLPTRMLLGLSDHLKSKVLFYAVGIAAAWMGFKYWVANPKNIMTFDKFKLNLPIAGPVVRSISIVRMLRTLSALLGAGVPILRALELTRDLAGNAVFRELFAQVYTSVSEGHGISSALRANAYFPQTVTDMVANAEKTGSLPAVLSQVAVYYEKETDTTLKNLFAAIEPLFVVFLGIMVGGIAVAILLPIFEMGNNIK